MNFDLPKVRKTNINFELLEVSKIFERKFENLYISSHREVRNTKFGHLLNIERVPLGTPPQAVVMSLAHNHLTNLELQRNCCYQI